MHKLLSILMLVLFGLPTAAPLLAMSASGDAKLPACCRRNGKHHCVGSMQDGAAASSGGAEFRAPMQCCPCAPAAVSTPHTPATALPPALLIFAGVQSHPAVFAQTASRYRIARDRSKQKRGPPSVV